MKRIFVILLMVIGIVCAACNTDNAPTPPPETVSPSPTASYSPVPVVTPSAEPTTAIETLDIQREEVGGTGGTAEYPIIGGDGEGVGVINDYLRERGVRGWGEEGRSTQFETGYNANGVVSFLYDVTRQHEDDDSADVTFEALTVDANAGVRVTLDDVFTVPREQYLELLIRYTESGEAEYVEGYLDNAVKTFEPDNFYLETDSVVIFYPPSTALVDLDEWFFQSVPFEALVDVLSDWVVVGGSD